MINTNYLKLNGKQFDGVSFQENADCPNLCIYYFDGEIQTIWYANEQERELTIFLEEYNDGGTFDNIRLFGRPEHRFSTMKDLINHKH